MPRITHPQYKRRQKVEVVKAFKETRTPCPAIGTVGKVVAVKADFVHVEFWSFTDTDGATWGPGRGDGSEPFVFYFKPDEIKPREA